MAIKLLLNLSTIQPFNFIMWQQITDKNYWNNLVAKQLHARFLQSWEWGEFQCALRRKVLRFASGREFAQAIKMNLPGGFAYWYIPQASLSEPSFSELQKMLGEHGALFLRADPITTLKPQNKIKTMPSVQPQCTLLLDLSQSEEEISGKLHSKTRYNINLAQKKGVKIGLGSVDDFIKLNRATTKRDKFESHPAWYYKKMSGSLENGDCQMKVWQASFGGCALASALVVYFGDTATYVHGASSDDSRNVMAPYLLHWEIIKAAKEKGFKYYDWWGINPADENHPAYKKSWQGISRFKRGFGGDEICCPDSFDLIYRPVWYSLYKLMRRVRSII